MSVEKGCLGKRVRREEAGVKMLGIAGCIHRVGFGFSFWHDGIVLYDGSFWRVFRIMARQNYDNARPPGQRFSSDCVLTYITKLMFSIYPARRLSSDA